MDKFISKVKGGGSPHVFFIKGDEPFYNYRILSEVLTHYRRKNFLIEMFDGSKISESELVDALDTSSLFGESKLVVVRTVEKIKGKIPALSEYLKSPSENVVALFEGNGEIETPLGKALEANAVTFVGKALNPYKKDIENWLMTEAGTLGFTLPEGLAKTIRVNTGESLFALNNALRKVLLHVDGKVVDRSDLIAVLSKTSTNQAFEITTAFGEKNLTRCLQLIDIFFHQEEDPSLLIVSSLLNYIEKLINAKSLLNYGLASSDAAKVLGMSPWIFQDKLEPNLKKFSVEELIHAFSRICDVDIRIKSSGIDKKVLIENFLVFNLLGDNK